MSAKLVNPEDDFAVVYSIYEHEFLGCVISSHIVKKLPNGNLSLLYQGVYPSNLSHFARKLDEADIELIRLLAQVSPKEILLKFGKGKVEHDFFSTQFKGELKDYIRDYFNRRMAEAILKLEGKPLFTMSNDGYPAYKPVKMLQEKATVYFHFKRSDEGTLYYPTLKLRGQRIDFQFRHATLVGQDPAWILLDGELFTFTEPIQGMKLKPFLNKKFISVPRNKEEEYVEKFIAPLIEKYEVVAHGFEINQQKLAPNFSLVIKSLNDQYLEIKPVVQYGRFNFNLNEPGGAKVFRESVDGNWRFFKILRSKELETFFLDSLTELKLGGGVLNFSMMERGEALTWLHRNTSQLEERGIALVQHDKDLRLNFRQHKLVLEANEAGDWFDIKAVVEIGEYRIPFFRFKNHILRNKHEYVLPDNSIFLMPDEWFSDYRHLIEVAVEKNGDTIAVKKSQAGVLGLVQENNSNFRLKIGQLLSNPEVVEVKVPVTLKAEMRNYQKAGYDWLHFLKKNNLGGILADDMGLGKTLQALSFLLRLNEQAEGGPALIVMPTSLIFNWQNEAAKFAPRLKVLVYQGMGRDKNPDRFTAFDLILTTYGTVRQDVEILKEFSFHYLILDESQMIKNPESKTYRAVCDLKARYRLTLTGTPVENSLMDLWSQVSFLNPGFLGSENFFRNFYSIPIEKEADTRKRDNLKKLIHPIMLRRTKQQVALDLPDKVDQVYYCEMEDEQEDLYEKTKHTYRNYLMGLIQSNELKKNKLNVLAGLQKLRQIAIHPRLIEEGKGIPYSGKYEEIRRMLKDVIAEGSKVLVFSQFVKFLEIVKSDLDADGVSYCYLTGATTKRQAEVEKFQNDPSIKVFLISLKAGGTGLNLTAAEYVFILDPWWNPAVENQAIDRTHRIGQLKTVFSYRFITRNTIEEKILKLKEKKSKLSSDVVAEDDLVKNLEQDELMELLS